MDYILKYISKEINIGIGDEILENTTEVEYETYDEASTAYDIAWNLREAIDGAAFIARNHHMERAFAIAPTASCSYRSKGLTRSGLFLWIRF